MKNFSKASRSLFAVVVALSMLLSVAMPAIAGGYDHIHGSDDGINFVVVGDSMANGYGTDGYYPGQYVYAGADKGEYKITEYGAFVYVGEGNGNFTITDEFLTAGQLDGGRDDDLQASIDELVAERTKYEAILNAVPGSTDVQAKIDAINAEIKDIELAKAHNENRFGYLMEAPEAWPTLVRDALVEAGYDVDFKNLSISGMRPTELRYLLDSEFLGDVYTEKVFAPGVGTEKYDQEHRFCHAIGCACGGEDNGNCSVGYEQVSNDYFGYITNADLIAIQLGTNTFGTLLTAKLGAAAMGGGSHYADKSFKDVLESEEDIALYEEYEAKIVAALAEQLGSTELVDLLKPYVDVLAYSVATFVRDYMASYDIIKELNPDANIVIVGLSNPLEDVTITVDEDTVIDMELLFEGITDAMSTFLAAYTNEGAYFAEIEDIDLMVNALARDEMNPVYEAKFIDNLAEIVKNDALIPLMASYYNFLAANDNDHLLAVANIIAVNGAQNFVGTPFEGRTDYIKASIEGDIVYIVEDMILSGGYAGLGWEDGEIAGIIDALEAGTADSTQTKVQVVYGCYSNADLNDGIALIQGAAEPILGGIELYESAKAAIVKAAGDNDLNMTTFSAIISGEGNVMDSLIPNEEEGETLVDVLNGDVAQDVLQAFARLMLAEGVGIHPSETGHKQIADAVIDAIANEYTGVDHIVSELEKVGALIAEYYDDAYAYGYEYARDNGYIAIAIDAIAVAEVEIDRAYGFIASTELSDELKAELYEEIDLAKVILADVKAMLENDELDQLDAEALDALCDLLAKLGDALYNIGDIAGVVYADVYAVLYEKWITEWKPAVEAAIDEIAEAARIYIEEKLDELYAKLQAEIEKLEKALCDAIKDLGNEIYGEIAPVIEKVQAILNCVTELNARLEAAIDSVEGLREGLVNAWNTLADLIKALNDKYDSLEDAKEDVKQQIQNAIDELEAKIEEVKALIENIKAEIEKIRAEIAEIRAEIEAKIEEVKAVIDAVKAVINEENIKAEIEKIENSIAALGEKIELLELVVEMIVDGATTGSYTVDADSFYVALGDLTAAGESYVDIFAEALGVKYENLAEAGQTLEDALAALAENEDVIAKADLITLGFGNAAITEFMFAQMNALISGTEPAEMNWANLVGEKAVLIEGAVAAVTAKLAEQGLDADVMGVSLAELITLGVESYVYAYTARAILYPVIVDAVAELAPEALIIVVGTYNDLDGITFDVEGTEIDLGDLIEATVDLANLSSFANALTTANNVIYVGASNVETVFEADLANGAYEAVNLITYFNAIVNGDLAPSEDGHAYIAEKLLASLEVTKEEIKDPCADGHTFGDWVTVKPATETEEGLKERVCSVCGHKETEKIAKLPASTTTPVDPGTTPVDPPVTTPSGETDPLDPPATTPIETTPIDVPDTTPSDTNNDAEQQGLPVGAIVGISVAAVAVVAGGGFCLYWFVFKKKIV